MASLNDIVPSGVVTGDDLLALLEHARANNYAIPAVNCTRYVIVEPPFSDLRVLSDLLFYDFKLDGNSLD